MTKNQPKVSEISLFLPTYNEEEVIAQTIKKSDKILKKIAAKYEILVVNDGSTDDTAKVVKKLIEKNDNIRMITHDPNRGYGGALKSGLKESKYSHISFIDSDGQFDYSEIDKFLPYLGQFDLVIGYRLDRQDNILRKLNALLWKLWVWLLFGLWVKDIDCGFKVVKDDVVDNITLSTESAFTEAEFLIRAKQQGFSFKQVGVHHYPRTVGTATGADFKVIFKAVKESILLWYKLNFLSHDSKD